MRTGYCSFFSYTNISYFLLHPRATDHGASGSSRALYRFAAPVHRSPGSACVPLEPEQYSSNTAPALPCRRHGSSGIAPTHPRQNPGPSAQKAHCLRLEIGFLIPDEMAGPNRETAFPAAAPHAGHTAWDSCPAWGYREKPTMHKRRAMIPAASSNWPSPSQQLIFPNTNISPPHRLLFPLGTIHFMPRRKNRGQGIPKCRPI